MNDDANILPGNDTIDDDPNENGELEQNDSQDRRRNVFIPDI